MRDLKDYEEEYQHYPFEAIQTRFRKRRILESLAKYPHERVLEVGCGLDPLFSHCSDFEELVIVEPVELFYQHATAALTEPSFQRKVAIRHALLEDDMDFLRSRAFQFVVLAGMLHEVESPAQILNCLLEISSPETVIHINVPNARSFHRLLALEMGLVKDVHEKSASNERLQQNTVFDLGSLSDLVLRSGFRIVDSGTFVIKPFTHQQMQDMIDENVLTEDVIEGLYGMSRHLPEVGAEIYMDVSVA
jgi:hypothetical protein